jgi:ankyrin repeat protein
MSAELFSAVASRNAERVRELLASDPGAASAKDGEGATPQHYATLNGSPEIAELLSQCGADVNARDGRFGATPAGWAIEYLREAGGLLGIEIDDLLFAIREKDVRWVRRFVTRLPALARAKDSHGKALSQHAAESGNDEIGRVFETVLGQQ